MTLTQRAYLTIEDSDGTAVFEFNRELEEQTEIEKSYILAGRGEVTREIFDYILDDPESLEDANRRTGYFIDGGAGAWRPSVSFKTGLDDVRWGDGTGGDGPENVTKRDASGAGVSAYARKNVLEWWVTQTRSDSEGQAFWYYGEWSDGTYADEPGAIGRPMPVGILDLSVSTPNVRGEDVVSLEGTLSLIQVSLFPEIGVDFVEGARSYVNEQLGFITDW